jgi:YfiR/HmsC-like
MRLGILLAAGLASATLAAEGPSAREYQLKAVFLFNFVQFTEWPPEAFADKEAPLVIGILGSDPFGEALEATVRNEVVRGRRLQVKRFKTVAEMRGAHILYIGQSEASRLSQALKALKGKPILTVSDIENAARRGIMIGFTSDHNRIRFQINPETAKAANLTLSSKLLRVSEIVEQDKKQ